jgi:hypothetical protein
MMQKIIWTDRVKNEEVMQRLVEKGNIVLITKERKEV